MTLITKIQKWGNSQGLRFPKTVLEEARINVGDEVKISVEDGKIVVESVHQSHGKYTIAELVSNIPENYETEELDWGTPAGKEVW